MGAENARLLELLRLTPQQAAAPVPGQVAFFEAVPGVVHHRSPQEAKVAFFGALFVARTDVYAVRYDNQRTGKSGWVPAVRGGWQKGVRHEDRGYLPLTPAVLAAHLKGEVHIGLYPLLNGDKCWWLAADFDGAEAMFDALMYVKAGRALQVPVALEVSRSGVGAHAWVFFTSPVPAEMARRLGTGLLREAMALRGRMSLASYDRLFPSQDLLPAGGVGNLIAAPLFRPARDNGATVFLDPETLERHDDQWAYLSTLGRMTPRELKRAADRAGKVTVATEVTRLSAPSSTATKPGRSHRPANAAARRATAASRSDRPVRRGGLRLPATGYPVPRRARREQGQPPAVRREDPAPLRRQGYRRGPRLPAHRGPRLITGQARPRLHQPRLPRPP